MCVSLFPKSHSSTKLLSRFCFFYFPLRFTFPLYAFNLIHSPSEDAIERGAVEMFLKHGVTTVEASAFLGLTPNIVRYRVAGLRRNAQNQIVINNRVIAKISRTEVASKFMAPAPDTILQKLFQLYNLVHNFP